MTVVGEPAVYNPFLEAQKDPDAIGLGGRCAARGWTQGACMAPKKVGDGS
jgi:hypothetical protein